MLVAVAVSSLSAASLYQCRVRDYDSASKRLGLFCRSSDFGYRSVTLSADSQAAIADPLLRLLDLWYIFRDGRDYPQPEESPEISVVVSFAEEEQASEDSEHIRVTLKSWSVRLPIVLQIPQSESNIQYIVLDDGTVAFGRVLNETERKAHVILDQQKISEIRKRKKYWDGLKKDWHGGGFADYVIADGELMQKLEIRATKPNKALVPTVTSVTPAADAPVAPAAPAAHLCNVRQKVHLTVGHSST